MFVVKKQVVAQALARLREQKTHTLFAGYLYLQRLSVELRRQEDLQPDFRRYFDEFFRVQNHPLGTPYIKIFTEQRPSEKNLWLNENVAGSYAPSSLRPDQPFRQVVDIADRKYSLPSDHVDRAFEHLLYNEPVQVADLAAVMYRDFGFHGTSVNSNVFGIDLLVGVFCYEFGYERSGFPEQTHAFNTLFSTMTMSTFAVSNFEEI